MWINLPMSKLAFTAAPRVTRTTTGVVVRTATGGMAALLASLVGVNLAMGKFASADALVWLAVLAESVVLYDYLFSI
jgi:hypothetical protein